MFCHPFFLCSGLDNRIEKSAGVPCLFSEDFARTGLLVYFNSGLKVNPLQSILFEYFICDKEEPGSGTGAPNIVLFL